MTNMKARIGLLIIILSRVGPAQRLYDFQFRGMDLRRAVESIAVLEKKSVVFSQSVPATRVDFSLKRVTPAFAIEIILKNHGLDLIKEKNVIRVVTRAERGPSSSVTMIFPLKEILAKDLENNIKSYLGSEGSVSINEQQNALIINAPDSLLNRVGSIIRELDQPNHQIFIEAKVVETTTSFSRKLGIEWGSPLGGRPPRSGANLSAAVADAPLIVGIPTTIANRTQLEARLTAGERNGEARIVSSPKITTLNGVGAFIESSFTFNVRTLAPVSGTGSSGAALAGGLQAVRTGIRLKVTPSILNSERVRLDLQLSKSEPDFTRLIDGIPGVSDSSAMTSLVVDNGETASIGGLIQQSRSSAVGGAPLLSRIPILGLFFGSLEKESRDSELLIFLTPIIKVPKSL